MTLRHVSRAQILLLGWTLLTCLVSLLPTGAGGFPRAMNAVVFMTFGPACGLMALWWRTKVRAQVDSGHRFPAPEAEGSQRMPVTRFPTDMSPALAVVVSMGMSLSFLILSSQLLLLLGLWEAYRVVAVVQVATVLLALLPTAIQVGEDS